jgi:hypothetical protein
LFMAVQIHGAAMLFSTLHPALPGPAAEPSTPALDLADRPALAVAYLLAGGLMELCGPLFWAILAVGLLFAEFSLD